ncbi:MAG: GGDEF domain-containing protein [Gammaproteobacteria bacterium]
MKTPHRRATDRRRGATDRRSWPERRGYDHRTDPPNHPSWNEQVVQFVTRYLFFGLGVVFFNFTVHFTPLWMPLYQVNIVYGVYFVCNTALFLHARRHPYAPSRYRLAMWLDIAMVSISLLNDPYDIPPSALVYIMVVLGNGMRYGMRLFAEALAGCFGSAMIILSLRYLGAIHQFSAGVVFLNLFGAIILVYAYILMSRIEVSRRKLEQSSNIDTLTGLFNRRALFDRAEHLFRRIERNGHPLVVMFADMDKFKHVNDTYGHAIGDRVLQCFARVLRESIRAGDLAARHGGDEFVLLLVDTDLSQAQHVARRVQDKIAAEAGRLGVDCSITIGMGQAPLHGSTLSELLERVDQALYHSKGHHGRAGIMAVGAVAPGTEDLAAGSENSAA